ncbi:hypothetical protein BGX31_003819, partial [Mortierella sp. GBA43]
FSNRCTEVNTLDIEGVPCNKQFDEAYWNDVEALLRQNSACLRSLTLWGWCQSDGYRDIGQPIWKPLSTCAQHSNLSTLKIHSVTISRRDMQAFWGIGQQLEILELTDTKADYREIELTTTPTPAVRFPKLRKLRLENLDMAPAEQLRQFVVHCPLLQSLTWSAEFSEYLMHSFGYHLDGTWPCLDWIDIVCTNRHVADQEYAKLLEKGPRSLRCLNVNVSSLEEPTFNLYRELGHFKTLTKIVLIPPSAPSLQSSPGSVNSKQVQEVLESCPLLDHIAAVIIMAQDIIQGKPWVCHRLRWFQVTIGLETSDNNQDSQAGNEDRRTQSQQIFERLGQLKQLTVLDMGVHNQLLNRQYVMRFTSPPLTLEMGLGHLSTLRELELIGFHGSQEIEVVDMEWMLQNWMDLRCIHDSGGTLTVKWTKTSDGVIDERSRLVWETLKWRDLAMFIYPGLPGLSG